jgi:hypothetical protein
VDGLSQVYQAGLARFIIYVVGLVISLTDQKYDRHEAFFSSFVKRADSGGEFVDMIKEANSSAFLKLRPYATK